MTCAIRLVRVTGSALWLCVAAGCSPYVYKQEIDGFATGVKDLTAAYHESRGYLATRDQDKVDAQWVESHARLTITACEFRDPSRAGTVECVLHEIAQPVPAPLPDTVIFREVAVNVETLSRYATALAAVANAADREALTAAQAKLKTAVQGFAKEAAGGTVAGVGPAVDLFSSLTAALLDQQRYDILRSGVAAAREPVRDLGGTLAVALGGVWMERASALRKTASADAENLGSGKDYPARLKKLREKVAALETLRAKNPGLAAADMVVAHDALAKALIDDSRQAEAVATAVTNFLAQAAAAREAFEK
jgi:hypothetical protein